MLVGLPAPDYLNSPPPFVVDDWLDSLHDTVLTGNLLSNDYDPDGDPLSVRRFSFNGTNYEPGQQIAITQGDQTAGYLTVNADGSFQFVPSLRYKGSISLSYTIFDGEYESTAWVTVNVYNKLVEQECRAAPVPAEALSMSIISRPGERPAVLRPSQSRTISVGHNAPQASDRSFDVLHYSDLSGDLLSFGYDLDGDTLNITAINGTANLSV